MKRNLLKIVTLCAAVALCLSAILCFSLTASAATTTIYDADVTARVTFANANKGVYVNVAAADTALQNDYAANGAGVYTVSITGTSDAAAVLYPCIIDAAGSDIWPGGAHNYELAAGTEGTIYGDITFNDVAPKKIWVYIEEVTAVLSVSHIKIEVTREGGAEPSEEPSEDSEIVSEDSDVVSEDSDVVSEDSDVVSEDSDVVSEDSEVVSEDSDVVSEDSEDSETSETSEPGELVYGDADGDNDVTMKDVLAMRKFIANMDVEINEEAADVDGDGEVTMKDVLLVRKYIAKLITEFPVEAEGTVSDVSEEISETSEEISETSEEISETSEEASEEASEELK